MTTEFELNEKVAVKDEGFATITDKMYSEGAGKYYYTVKLLNGSFTKKSFYPADCLQKIEVDPTPTYSAEVVSEDRVVILRIYETVGDNKKLIHENHGHMFHDGEDGYIQALSYATKRLFNEINGDKEYKRYGK